jgi:transposase
MAMGQNWACSALTDIHHQVHRTREMPIMETMERNKRRARGSFSAEFEADIVGRCRAGDHSIAQAAQDFDLTVSAVRRWVAQADIDKGTRPGLTSDERTELAQLRRETPAERGRRHLEADNNFLREGDPVRMDPFIEAEEVAATTSPRRVGYSRPASPPTASAATASLRLASSTTPNCWERSRPPTKSPREPIWRAADPPGALALPHRLWKRKVTRLVAWELCTACSGRRSEFWCARRILPVCASIIFGSSPLKWPFQNVSSERVRVRVRGRCVLCDQSSGSSE